MQLFTIGVHKLNMDGTLELDSSGLLLPMIIPIFRILHELGLGLRDKKREVTSSHIAGTTIEWIH